MLVAITGASGVQLAVKFLQSLKQKGIESELIISKNAETIIDLETHSNLAEIKNLASKNYDVNDLTAPPASGSYLIDKMVIIPCSMKTLAAIASGYSDNSPHLRKRGNSSPWKYRYTFRKLDQYFRRCLPCQILREFS